MDYLDGFVVETEKARDTAVTVFNNFAGILKGMREQLTNAAAEVDRQERLAGVMRAKLQTEAEGARKELDKVHLEIREAKRELERVIKETARHKAEIRKIMDDIMGRAA
jgi:hypothetical protein